MPRIQPAVAIAKLDSTFNPSQLHSGGSHRNTKDRAGWICARCPHPEACSQDFTHIHTFLTPTWSRGIFTIFQVCPHYSLYMLYNIYIYINIFYILGFLNMPSLMVWIWISHSFAPCVLEMGAFGPLEHGWCRCTNTTDCEFERDIMWELLWRLLHILLHARHKKTREELQISKTPRKKPEKNHRKLIGN